MPGIFGSGKPRLLGQVPEEIGGGRAPFAFSDTLGGAPRLVDVPQSGPGADPQTVLQRVESKPTNPLLKGLAIAAALGGRGSLLNYLEGREQEPLEQQKVISGTKTILNRQQLEKQKQEFERSQPIPTEVKIEMDSKGNVTVANVDRIRALVRNGIPSSEDLRSAVFHTQLGTKTLKKEQFAFEIDQLEKTLGYSFKPEERASLSTKWTESVEAGDITPWSNEVSKITAARRSAEEKAEARGEAQEFRKELQEDAQQARRENIFLIQSAINERRKLDPSMYQLVSEQVESGQMSIAQITDVNDRAIIQSLIRERGGVVMTPKLKEQLQKLLQVRGIASEAAAISEKVNTAPGGAAPVIGGLRKIGEVAGLDPNATRLETLRAALGPMARAISSEVGVLTNPDIDRAQVLIPNVYDSKSRAQAKLEQLNKFITLMEKALKLSAGATVVDIDSLSTEMSDWRADADRVIKEGSAPAKFKVDLKTGKVVKK